MGHFSCECPRCEGGGKSSGKDGGSGGDVTCYRCGMVGHKSSECNKRKTVNGADIEEDGVKEVSFVWTIAVVEKDESEWKIVKGRRREERKGEITVDSGAEESVCPKGWCEEFGLKPVKGEGMKFKNSSGG